MAKSALEQLAEMFRPKQEPMSTPVNPEEAMLQQEALAQTQRGLAGTPSNEPIGISTGRVASTDDPKNPKNDEYTNLILQIQAREAAEKNKMKELESYLRQGVADQEAMTKAPANDRTDLSPLLALTDTWFGGNLSKGYTRPPSKEERRQQDLTNIAALQQRKEALASIAARGGGTSYSDMLKLSMAKEKRDGTQRRFDERESKVTDKQVENINKLESALQETATLGREVDGDFVGPLDQFRSTTLGRQIPGNEKAAAFQSRLGALVDTYRHMVTGAAAADAELKRIEGRMPQVTDNEEVFKEKAREVIARLKDAHRLYLDDLQKKGKDVGNFRSFSFDTSVESVPAGVDKKIWESATPEQREEFLRTR